MITYQDTNTGELWNFDAGTNIAALKFVPATLSIDVRRRPSARSVWVNGAWEIDQVAEDQYLVDSKSAALRLVAQYHADYLANNIGHPSKEDMASWEFKKTLALTIKSGAPVYDESKNYLNDAGVTDFPTWADGILAKSRAYLMYQGRADYLRGTHKSAIRLTASKDELDALMIDIGIGWEALAIQP